jgi:hypothetical protein
MGGLRDDLDEAEDRLAKLEARVSDLERFRAWVLGISAGVGAILAFFAEGIRKRFGLGD